MLASARLHVPAAILVTGAVLLIGAARAAAQIPQPPTTFYGSVTDAAGRVPAGVPIVAIVNNNICGETTTVHVGEGSSLVTMYVIDVISDRQTPGCGTPGDAVRLRVGDRLAEEAVQWAGTGELVQFDIVFGDATPDVIPTATRTPIPSATESVSTGSPETEATPGTGTPDSSQSPSRTQPGGVSTTTPAAANAGDSGDGDGGLPLWALLALAVGGIAAVGGGIGFAISRGNSAAGPESLDPPSSP